MNVKNIINREEWNRFFDAEGSPSFLQSWEWGEFQRAIGYRINRVGVYQSAKLIAIAQIIIILSKRGNFLFIPHGPLTASVEKRSGKTEAVLTKIKKYLIDLAEKERCSFIRIAPIFENISQNQELFSRLGFRKAPIYMHAERVWVLPLTSEVLISKTNRQTSEVYDQLLSNMRKTTRYSIRRAARDGVVIEKRTDPSAVDDFYSIYKETAKREKFVPFSKEFIKKEFEAFNKTGNTIFLFAKHRSYLASALILFTKSTAFYHQGASLHTKVPSTSLLQWEAIKEAKNHGCSLYNFWGILQQGRTPKNWDGLTLFKTGFGGYQKDYLFTQDYVLSPMYYLTYLYEQILKLKRGIY